MKNILKMKNIAIYLLIFSTLSCSKLDLLPESQIPNDGFYTTDAEMATLVAGMYDGLQLCYSRDGTDAGGLWAVTDVRSDDLTVALPEGEWGSVESLTLSPESDITLDFWKNSYLTIARANNLIANVNVVANATLKNQYEGEGKFVRALAYFNLVRLFGDIPLTLEPVTSSDKLPDLTRKTVAEVYTQIEKDLTEAKGLLPATTQTGRASAGATKGLLAKVYLTQDKIAEAKAELEDVMNDQIAGADAYALQASVADVFSPTNESNNEILFSAAYKSASNGEGQNFTYDLRENTIGFLVTADYMSKAPDGVRKTSTVRLVGTENRTIKYNAVSSAQEEGDHDWIVLRYADIILMYAEVLNREGITETNRQNAIVELNKIRTRSGLSTYQATDFQDSNALATAIKEERRFELGFEGHRWFDLQRYSDGLAILTAQLGATVTQNQLLLPIPQSEINVSNKVMTQNPGY